MAQIENHFFNGDRCIGIKRGLEGQTLTETGKVLIGDRAGPSLEISNLVHEMCHFVEIDDVRMKMRGWGLRVPEIWVFDRMCVEPRTMQMTERELRVAAYQANVLKYLGYSDDTGEITSSFKYLPDILFVPMEDGRSAWGIGSEDLGYDKKTESQLRWLANRAQELRSEYTLDRFMNEWERKSFL